MPRAKQGRSKSKVEQQADKQSQTAASPASQGHQKTISDLFSASKQGLDGRIADAVPGSSPNKRLKTTHPSAPVSSPLIGSGEMYNFPVSNSNPRGVIIDLTSPPNVSPAKKKKGSVIRPSTFGSHTGSKKLVVRNLKTISRPDPDEYFNRVWGQLDAALTAIFAGNELPFSMEELYKGVEFTSRQDRGPMLFSKLQAKCESGILTAFEDPVLQKVGSSNDIDTLDTVVLAWSQWTSELKVIHRIFYYLDRAYLLYSTHLPSLQVMGASLFRDHIFANPSLQPKILQGACDSIKRERTGQPATQLVRDAIKMFIGIGVYDKHFTPKLIDDSAHYYDEYADQLEGSNDLAGYIHMSQKIMRNEKERSESLGLDQITCEVLREHLAEALIDEKKDRLTREADVVQLMAEDRQEALQQLFALLEQRHIGVNLKQPWDAYINKQGSEIVFDEENEEKMVPRLLDFKRRLDHILERCFQKHETLSHSLRGSFENFINKSKRSNMTWGTDNTKPGEMIAKYVDLILKGGPKAVRSSAVGVEMPLKVAEDDGGDEDGDEDTEITRSLDQVLDLFRFVHGKAVFEAFYKRDLARRLLLARSASSDAEKSMLVRLKSGKTWCKFFCCLIAYEHSECGAGFTHNLEQMFKDIEIAKEEMKSYRQTLEDQEKHLPFDLSVNVLSASAWPSYHQVQVIVRPEVLLATADFERQYNIKHTGRKLEWKHAMAHCQLRATFPKGNKEIVVSSFQAIVLLAFNSNETISYADLQELSGLGKQPKSHE